MKTLRLIHPYIFLPKQHSPHVQTWLAYLRVVTILVFVAVLGISSSGHTAPSPKAPQRIISLSPSITETLFALGAGSRVVGVTDFCKWPKEACQLPKIGGLLNPNIETWIALKPDLVIMQETSHRLKQHANNLGIPILLVDMSLLSKIFDSINKIGNALLVPEASRKLISTLNKGLSEVESRLKALPEKSVLLILGDSADPERDLYAVGPSTFLGELMERAGGRNLLKGIQIPYPRVSKEYIIKHSPEIIIEAGPRANMPPEEQTRRMKAWNRYSTVKAVREKKIFFIGADHILIPGPRMVETLKAFAQVIHPEAFANGALK